MKKTHWIWMAMLVAGLLVGCGNAASQSSTDTTEETSASNTQEAGEGLDADSNSYLKFNGGAVFTSGGQQMNSSSPTCTVPVVYLAGSSMSKGYFTVTDANGNVVMSVYVPRAMSQNYSFVSSSGIKSGSTYKYGVLSSAPSNYTSSWGTYYYEGGTVSSTLGSSFTASSGYSTTGSTSSSSGGIPGRW